MQFFFAGGAMEVGASCIYVRLGEYGILFDSGIRQGAGSKDPLPDFAGIQQAGGVDAIVVSHAHMDHTGSLPVISGAFPKARIYMTPMTLDLTRVLLLDSIKLMGKNEDEIPKYGENEMLMTLGRVIPVHYQVPTEILPGVEITMYPAGHIAGAACVYLTSPDGSLLYTGDVSGFAQQTIEGIALPKLRPDVAILESTYGNRLHSNRNIEEQRLVTILDECVRAGKKVLIPAFALGRSQEVLLIIRKAFADKKLMEVPVYVDGMVRDMNRVYTMHPFFLKRNLARRIMKGEDPFFNDRIVAVTPRDNRGDLVQKEGAAIFVSSSGMLSGGPSVEYAKQLLPNPNACVILTGYQDEESPGRMLLRLLEETEEAKMVTLDNMKVNVKARVEMVGLSAHSDSSELAGIIEKTTPRHVILVHGNEEAISSLGEMLSSDIRRRVYQPLDGETLVLDLKNKREQKKDVLRTYFFHAGFTGEEDAKQLYDYWEKAYPGRAFVAEDVAFLWFGDRETPEDKIRDFVDSLLETKYFERHPRRLHLIRLATAEEIAEAEKKSQVNAQVVEGILREALAGVPIKKIGYYLDRREAVLTVDFPDALPEDLFWKAEAELQEKTGWNVSVKPTMNFTAASGLLRQLFGTRLLSESYYQERKVYQISLASPEKEDEKKAELFQKATGWTLSLGRGGEALGEGTANLLVSGEDFFFPGTSGEMEQNKAMGKVREILSPQETGLTKVSLKSDSMGRYFELSFLSPAQGLKFGPLLQKAANATGYRMHISSSVDQNALMGIAGELCVKYGLTQAKNPSYQPAQQEILLRLVPGQDVPEAMAAEFLDRTGIRLGVK